MVRSLRDLLNYFLKLRAEHSSAVAIKRDMEPVSLFALDDKVARGKIRGVWLILSRLRDYVDHQVPGSRLTCLCQTRARWSFLLRPSLRD